MRQVLVLVTMLVALEFFCTDVFIRVITYTDNLLFMHLNSVLRIGAN